MELAAAGVLEEEISFAVEACVKIDIPCVHRFGMALSQGSGPMGGSRIQGSAEQILGGLPVFSTSLG